MIPPWKAYQRQDSTPVAPPRRSATRMCRLVRVTALFLTTLLVCARAGFAAGPAGQAAQMSDRSFALLSALTAASGGGNANPALGPMAVFAGDAQTLSHALAAGDHAAASAAVASLEADQKSVDGAVASRPQGFDANQWNGIKQELAAIARVVPATAPPSAPAVGAAPASAAAGSAVPPTSPAAAAGSSMASGVSGPPSMPDGGGAPQIVIESRTPEGDAVRVKGYMEGSNLRSAGIYQSGRELQAFHIDKVAGAERISFDLGLGNPSAGTTIRAYDVNGRMGEAFVLAAGARSAAVPAAMTPGGGAAEASNAPEIPAMRAPGLATEEGGVEVDRNSPGSSRTNLAVIPSHGAPRPSPSKRHTLASHLGDVHIDVIAVNQLQATPPKYEIVGQIQGRGVTRAGIYINGRLVHRIPISRGAGVNSFDQRFVLEGGAPTIRAYAMGDQFIETPIDLTDSLASVGTPPVAALPGGTMMSAPMMGGGTMMGGTMMGGAPMMTAPMMGAGIVIQIAAIGAISSNLDVVSGVISGNNLTRAGLYQNGMLVQAIPVSHGLGAIIGSLLPGHSNNVNFNLRFNPQAGPATIRAFDNTGAYAEQPVVAGGVTVNPYAAGMSPYGAYRPGMVPYGTTPYGTVPYGTVPYGTMPYGSAPYATNPYSSGTIGAPPINPYTTPSNPFAGPPVR